MKADVSQLEQGQIISHPETLPGCVRLARIRNTRNNTSAGNKKLVVIKKYFISDITESEDDDDIDVTSHIQHEVASMRQFDHPNIVKCLTSLVYSGQIWVVTPLAMFGSVRHLLEHESFRQGLPELVICLILRDVCHGLEYLHSQGVVHRSVRSSHILVNDNAAVLSGLRYSTGLQATGEGKPNLYSYPLHGVAHNLSWLAPEILQQNLLGYNEASDLYSLAVTMCEMANGVVPFSDMQPTLMMVEKLHGASATVLAQDNFSSHFHQLVAACCSIEQQQRPTARDLLGHPCIKQLKKTNTTIGTLLSSHMEIQFTPADEDSLKEDTKQETLSVSAWKF